MDENDVLSLENICNGAMPEIFRRELSIILANIADVNTPAEKKRAITFKFTFEPFPDRKGAQITLTSETKLAGVDGVQANAFIYRQNGELTAITQDARQERLFGKQIEAENVVEMKEAQ